METFSSSVSSSGESSFDISTGPTSPELSPLLQPQNAHKNHSTRLLSHKGARSSFDPDLLGPAVASNGTDADLRVHHVCVIGAGYVGGPTAAVLALHNPSVKVTVLDRDASRIAKWNSAHMPIHEPGLGPIVRLARDGGIMRPGQPNIAPWLDSICMSDTAGQDLYQSTAIEGHRTPNLSFSTDSATSISNADIIFLSVNTPTKPSGRGAGSASDLSAVEGAVRDIAQFAKAGAIIVEKSTVPCGTANLIEEILSALRPNDQFPILSNPEFLAEGSAVKNLLYPDRILIGSSPTVQDCLAASRLSALYATWVPKNRILSTNVWSSELAKLVANAMLAQRISSINSISALCERTGADVREIARAIGTDERIGSKFLKSGLGFGGSCFRKDISSLVYIAESLHLPEVAMYWRSVLTMNDFQRQRFTAKIVARLNNTLVGKKITLLGFAYKKDTGDTRESLAVDVIASLLEERPREIAIFDPCCPVEAIERELAHLPDMKARVKIYSDPYEACQNASAVTILTEWDLFKADSPTLQKKLLSNRSPEDSFSRAEAPLRTYLPMPEKQCSAACLDCKAGQTNKTLDTTQRLDWTQVANALRDPKYVLDGRGILDEHVLAKIGIHVEGLGWGSGCSSI